MTPDKLTALEPSQVTLTGWLGKRVAHSETNRLLQVDLTPLLAGYKSRPGSHPWIGEHIGKWLHASTLAWQNTGDARLKAKISGAVRELIACQEPDGYLGTYEKSQRFGLYPGADWDVWSHKYNLLGLLTWWKFTKDRAALDCCKRMGDLLCRTFGTGPGQKSLNAAGTHRGMAATSVLEPMALLHRATGTPRYLDFCRYIVDGAWSEPGGAGILKTLTTVGKVNKTANGKAYEMLSNLVGLCELHRTTGEKRFLTPVLRAWGDIVDNQLYLTGTMSHGEHFGADHDLPNVPRASVGETCVTVTWLQLNLQLLRLTGEARFAEEIERSLCNHLAAAQRPDGREWCYYTALEGTKPYGPGINCCVSSGPRGMALAPQTVCFVGDNGKTLVVASADSFAATVVLGGVKVRVVQKSPLPGAGEMKLTLTPERPVAFTVRRRVPAWAESALPGWHETPPTLYASSKTLSLSLRFTQKTVAGRFTNQGKTAQTLGPFVLASQNARDVLLADAGAKGERYRVWSAPAGTDEIAEDRSRGGNADGSILDGDPSTFVVTFDGSYADEDWYEVAFPRPRPVSSVTFAHGKTFHDGGWFVGPPSVQGKRAPGGQWETLGTLPQYPSATDTDAKGLRDGQTFTLALPAPVELVAVRIVGKPACGDSPRQRFSSCGELTVNLPRAPPPLVPLATPPTRKRVPGEGIFDGPLG